jgi:hypothetical protein
VNDPALADDPSRPHRPQEAHVEIQGGLELIRFTLKRRGVTRVRPLEGGFPAWRDRGFPVEALAVA